jgi:ribosomal protein L37E
VTTYTESVERPIPVAPCVRCGAVNVNVHDCGYSAFNVGRIRCNSCGYEVRAEGKEGTRQYLDHWAGEKARLETERGTHARRVAEIDAMHAFR